MHSRKKIAKLAVQASAAAAKLEHRANLRFPLRFAVKVKFGGNDTVLKIEALTENVSAGGILLQTLEPIPRNSEVGFVIDVRNTFMSLRLKSTGRVVRRENHPSGKGFWIAIQCDRPIQILRAVPSQCM
jgi:PilZ domain